MKKLFAKIDARVVYLLIIVSAMAAASGAPYIWSVP